MRGLASDVAAAGPCVAVAGHRVAGGIHLAPIVSLFCVQPAVRMGVLLEVSCLV